MLRRIANALRSVTGRRSQLPQGPRGRPVSRSLLLIDDARAFAHVLGLIDAVHGDGRLPKLPVFMADRKDIHAEIRQRSHIYLSRMSDHPHLALVHEVGHLLDYEAIGVPGVHASPSYEILGEWRDAVANSEATASLLALSRDTDAPVFLPETIAYLLRTTEQFARSYAQFIATASSDRRLREQLERMRHRVPGGVYYPQQWDDPDFLPIAAALQRTFKALRWMK